MSALQITTPLLYSSSLDLTFMAPSLKRRVRRLFTASRIFD